MKLFIKVSLLCIALICFSSIGNTQKKSNTKAKTSVSSKKKTVKKNTSKKKKLTNSSKKNKKKQYVKKPILKKSSNNKILQAIPLDQIKASSVEALLIKTTDTVPEKVVTIVSAFKPQLKSLSKISFSNATALVDTSSIILSYQVPSQNLSFQYQPIALVPRAIKKDSLFKINNTTNLKVGMGNYENQLFSAQTTLVDNNSNTHSIAILNESIAGPHPIQKWKDFGIKYLGDIHVNNQNKINSQLFFNQSSRYRYGLVPDTTKLPLSNFEQKLTTIGANISLVKFINEKSNFTYAPLLKFNHSNLFQQANDISIDLTSPIIVKLKNNSNLHMDFNYSFNQYNLYDKQSNNNYFLQMDPSLEVKKKQLKLIMGVRPSLVNGSFYLYPKFELAKHLKDTNYVIQAGWKTILNNNSITQLFTQNHWITAPTNLAITTNESKYVQLNVSANKRLQYSFNLALNDYRDLPFFNQTKLMNNPMQEGLKFDVLFEKRAIAIELKGDFRYQFSDKLLWKNHFKYIQFNLIRENEQAWGILPLELNSQFNWNMSKKLNFDAAAQFWTGSKTNSGNAASYQLNNTFVLNAGMQYELTKNWSFWAKGDNLLNQQYQRWANYPSLGIQFIAGIQYKFIK